MKEKNVVRDDAREPVPRSFAIKEEYLEPYGYFAACTGCRAVLHDGIAGSGGGSKVTPESRGGDGSSVATPRMVPDGSRDRASAGTSRSPPGRMEVGARPSEARRRPSWEDEDETNKNRRADEVRASESGKPLCRSALHAGGDGVGSSRGESPVGAGLGGAELGGVDGEHEDEEPGWEWG